MTPDPNILITPLTTAFPKYAGVFDALASLITSDSATTPVAPAPTAPTAPITPAPAAPVPVVPANPAAITVAAGQYVALGGGGAVCAFDFGDPTATFNTLRGYIAAHVYDQPGTFSAKVTPVGQTAVTTIVTVVADTRPQVSIAVGADLAAEIAKLGANTILLLPAGATFDLKAAAVIAQNGITLRATGSGAAPRIVRTVTPGSYSTLVVTGTNVSIEGIEFDSDHPLLPANNVKVGVYAINVQGKNLFVRNCNFRNIDDALHCNDYASGMVIVNCNCTNELRAYGAYLAAMQDVVILKMTAVGSVCEHIIRLEGAMNVLVDGCDVNNTDGKETIAIRNGSNVAVNNNTIRAWTRISQGISAQPGVYCKQILFAANYYSGLSPDDAWVALNPGSQTVLFDSNIFDVDANQGCIAVQAPSTGLTFTNNELQLVPGATTCKPLIRPFGNPTYTETGTITLPAKSA